MKSLLGALSIGTLAFMDYLGHTFQMGAFKVGAGASLSFYILFAASAVSAQSTEEIVRAYFSDVPIMAEIARCESKFTQFNSSGTYLRGGFGQKMIGVFQVYEDIHAEFAKGKGMDIFTLEGNMAYAKYLYEREGTQPWISSFPCWKGAVEETIARQVIYDVPDPEKGESVAIQPATAFSSNLSFGMEHEDVRTLQRFLNGAGYKIASSGPGSPGEETSKFGSLTREAVRAFQCAKMQLCSGDEYSNGYGYVGPKTRAALFGTAQSHSVTPPVGTTATVATSYTPEEETKIAALKAQILELTKVLQALLAAR
jgi:hypothetical protein